MKYSIEIDYDTNKVVLLHDGKVIAEPKGLVRGRPTIDQGIHEALIVMNGRHPPFAKGDTVALLVDVQSVHKVLDVRQHPDHGGDFDTHRWEVKIGVSKTWMGGWVSPQSLILVLRDGVIR